MKKWEACELIGCLPKSSCYAKSASALEPINTMYFYSGPSIIRHYRLNLVVKYAAPNAAQPPARNTHPVPVWLPSIFAKPKIPLQANAARICGDDIATLCNPIIAPAWTSLEVGGRSSPLMSVMQSRRDWRADNSLPMIANGAQRVRAQERPTEAMRKVAPAWEVMKKVASMASAK